jgi:hypothetical protein
MSLVYETGWSAMSDPSRSLAASRWIVCFVDCGRVCCLSLPFFLGLAMDTDCPWTYHTKYQPPAVPWRRRGGALGRRGLAMGDRLAQPAQSYCVQRHVYLPATLL